MVFSGLTSLLGTLTMSFCFGNWEEYMNSEQEALIRPWRMKLN